ncbi:nitroreductase family protein [Singulisphaera sp. Ch08]|uniref:Nitroreductase family protein n=1 Tax=Singulisphaera sp. Ch08 TaxID=3120278 RepID=A0AAU7CNJ5_9BACT
MDIETGPLVLEVIARRRTVRRFDPARPLADDLVRQILHAATLAPSDGNLQPWRFLVVRSESNRRKLRGCAFQHPRVAEAPVVVIVLGYHHPHRSHLDAMLARQLALGAITLAEQAEMRARTARAMDRRDDLPHWATRSTMLAVATLLMAAESLGVGSALMEAFEADKLRDAFGIPDDHTVCGLVALGYAAREESFPGRFELPEVCFEEHFGQPWTIDEP